ncbi:MAG: hypothetical protein OEV93_01205 [Candidatus Moranbacteria bacterium]|nr:hypothetical protein [Candidatus Moranbacteria bacterium]
MMKEISGVISENIKNEKEERSTEELIKYYFGGKTGFREVIEFELADLPEDVWISDLEILEEYIEDRKLQPTANEKAKLVHEISMIRRPEERK